MDRIDALAVFVAVADHRGFAAAARRLRRSPAAVTRAVGELEARLGVRLLNRTTRAVSITEAGERFLAGARRVLADLDEIERAAAGEGRAPRGELRLTAARDADRDRVPGSFSRRVGGAHAARSAG
jgi:DNA-binding transcriptional LysR family regulator